MSGPGQWGTAAGFVRALVRQQKIASSQPLIEGHGGLDGGFVVQALRDAIIYRTRLAAEPCPACVTHPSLMCQSCQAVLDLASVYRMLADQFEAEKQRAGLG
jgi:hypothetical protein